LNRIIAICIWAQDRFSPISPKDGLEQINESRCDYLVCNKPGEDMSKEDFSGIKSDFGKNCKGRSGPHKDTLEYKEYSNL
jgi:hypothetical protein